MGGCNGWVDYCAHGDSHPRRLRAWVCRSPNRLRLGNDTAAHWGSGQTWGKCDDHLIPSHCRGGFRLTDWGICALYWYIYMRIYSYIYKVKVESIYYKKK